MSIHGIKVNTFYFPLKMGTNLPRFRVLVGYVSRHAIIQTRPASEIVFTLTVWNSVFAESLAHKSILFYLPGRVNEIFPRIEARQNLFIS